jgi:hypothetical protein
MFGVDQTLTSVSPSYLGGAYLFFCVSWMSGVELTLISVFSGGFWGRAYLDFCVSKMFGVELTLTSVSPRCLG